MSEIAKARTLILKSKASQRFPSMLKNTLRNLVRSVFDIFPKLYKEILYPISILGFSILNLKPSSGTNMSREDETIFALRTTANREDQVMDFVTSNAIKKKIEVYSVIRPHGMRGYIFVEAATRTDAEQAAFNIPYARGILPQPVKYSEIEHMLEQVKHDMNIQKNDIVEIISGPFKRENAKVTRIDKTKEEVVVELLEAAVPIPITVKMDAVKVIRRDTDTPETKKEEEETGEENL